MNTIVKHIPHTVDLNEPVKKTYIDTLLATEDNLAHCFDIALMRGSEAVTLPDGVNVTAYFIRYCDNATLPAITGTVSGNVVSATLNKACYKKAGQYAIIIKVTEDEVTNTVFYGEGTIFASMTDTIIDPDNVVPSLTDLLEQIDVMEAATAASKTATTNAETATTRANNAAAKIEGMTASAIKAEEAGVTVSEVNGVKHFAFELPRGEKGERGDPGTIENVNVNSIIGLPEALSGKLGKDENAADSNKLGGKAPEAYVLHDDVLTLEGISASSSLDGKTVSAQDFKKAFSNVEFVDCENQNTSVMKFANIVFVSLSVITRNTFPKEVAWYTIAKIGQDYAPINDHVFSSVASGTTICKVTIDTAGNIKIMPRENISYDSGVEFVAVYAR